MVGCTATVPSAAGQPRMNDRIVAMSWSDTDARISSTPNSASAPVPTLRTLPGGPYSGRITLSATLRLRPSWVAR